MIKTRHEYKRAAAALTAAVVLGAAAPSTAFAVSYTSSQNGGPDYNNPTNEGAQAGVSVDGTTSPNFARSEEEWARLKDNTIEYDELADLIHEYNPTVKNNNVAYYRDRHKDYDTNPKAAWEEADLLSETADMSSPESDTTTQSGAAYANMLYQSAMSNYQSLMQSRTADSSLQDGASTKIQNDQQEASLVMTAQQMMNSYQQLSDSVEMLNNSKALLNEVYNSKVIQQATGQATQIDVLSAKKDVQDMESQIASTQKSLDRARRALCLMLGWKATDTPEIKPLPAVDLSQIELFNPEADLTQAIANNYDIRRNLRALENINISDNKKIAQSQIDTTKENIAAALKNDYNSILSKVDALNLAEAQLQLAVADMNTANVKLQSGSLSQLEYLSAQNDYIQKKVNRASAELSLFQAIETYKWVVKGIL